MVLLSLLTVPARKNELLFPTLSCFCFWKMRNKVLRVPGEALGNIWVEQTLL